MPRQTEELHFESHQERSTNERFKEPSSAQFEGGKKSGCPENRPGGARQEVASGPHAGTAVLRPPPVAIEQGEAGRIQAFPNPEPSSSVLLHQSIFIWFNIYLHVDPGSPQVPPTCPQVWSCCCPKPFWLWEKPTGAGGHFWKWHFVLCVVSCHGFLHWKKRKG